MGKTLVKPKIVVVCGQTGSGKTGLAVLLCKKFGGEIINADSRQVYREMDIGTAKGEIKKSKIKNQKYGATSSHTIKEVPVHLINLVSPNERYNVGRFKKDAERAIEDILQRGKVPFIVGGTGLYIDALVENFELSSVGARSPRPDLGGATPPLQDMAKRLKEIDPKALKIVDLKNRRRVERALEYCLTTGKKFSDSRKKGKRRYDVLKIAPMIDRETLHQRIGQRVEEMIDEGLEKEVRKIAKKYGWDSEAMTGIGYREWKGSPSPEEVKERIKIDTRQYAKRQMTWFKRDKEIHWVVRSKQAEDLVKKFLAGSKK